MSETILRECACGATFIPAGDECDCSACSTAARGVLVTPTYKPAPLFHAPQTLCGQLPMETDRHGR